MNAAQEYMRSRRWGVFTHFLYGAPSTGAPGSGDYDWNARCELYDVKRMARELHDIGANYYFITLMQGRKYMCAPNAAFDEIAGTKPGEACAKRDLILELSEELDRYGIDLCLYFTGDGPYKDVECGKRFGFIEPRHNVQMPFVRKWASVLEEYAVRYGDRIKAWWIDGCYREAFQYTEELLTPYYEACKKGNPNALVAMNNGVKADFFKYYSKEEMTAGEFNDFECIPKASDIDGALPHILAPLGVSPDGNPYGGWCQPGCKRDRAYMQDYIDRVNAVGGIVTVDIGIRYDGSLFREQLDTLRGI